MNSTKRSTTGFGLHDRGRQIARRVQQTLEHTERTDRPLRPLPAQLARFVRTEKRPLAA